MFDTDPPTRPRRFHFDLFAAALVMSILTGVALCAALLTT
jgi:hypothetical protein